MRIVLILLLLANLTLYAYTKLDTGSGEAVLLQDQIQPDKIKLLTPQQVAALGPAKVAALADVCIEWGPFADPERARALADMEPLGLGRLLGQRRVEFDSGYWVSTGPFPNRGAAETRVAELRRQGARELTIADLGRGQFAISFGNYRNEAAAVARADELARLGINLAKVGARNAAITQSMLVVRDPQQAVVARLKDLQAQYPGTDVKVGTCERST